MVKVETLHERKELLKILQSSRDTSALKAFVRYKGLSLLWTWMVDASEDKHKYKVEVSVGLLFVVSRENILTSILRVIITTQSCYNEFFYI